MEETARTLCRKGQIRDAVSILAMLDYAAEVSTYIDLLRACIKTPPKTQTPGKLVHAHMIQTGAIQQLHKILHNTLLSHYAKLGALTDAPKVFTAMSLRDDFAWTALISGYAKTGYEEKAQQLYTILKNEASVKPSRFTLVAVINASKDIVRVKQLHQEARNYGYGGDAHVGSVLVMKYAQLGHIEDARQVFDKIPQGQRDLILWNSMIAGYVKANEFDESVGIFKCMRDYGVGADNFTFASVIRACGMKGDLANAKWVHGLLKESSVVFDSYIGSTLIDMYVKCGSVGDARQVFDEIDEGFRNVVVWNSMIGGYANNGYPNQALELYRDFKESGLKPNCFTYNNVIPACSKLASLEQGEEIHRDIVSSGFQDNVYVGSCLVDMYAKCGNLEKAKEVFLGMPSRNDVTWTAMIDGFAMHGAYDQALKLFDAITSHDITPSDVTFLCVMNACCHAGFVDKGKGYFESMSRDFGIAPGMKHYGCLIGLLGRAGRLEEALQVINNMPMKADASVLLPFLSGCRTHNNVELGEWAAKLVMEMEPGQAPAYVLLSNIYASAGRWEQVEELRKKLNEMGIKKEPGSSWIEIDRQVHSFLADDSSHPRIQEIHEMLDKLNMEMKAQGHVTDTGSALMDVEEEQKEHSLYHHSEKLALVLGLVSTPPKTTLRIIKNLRICQDCHSFFKLVSKITEREIIVRDNKRFHYFKTGLCSCKDFW